MRFHSASFICSSFVRLWHGSYAALGLSRGLVSADHMPVAIVFSLFFCVAILLRRDFAHAGRSEGFAAGLSHLERQVSPSASWPNRSY